MRLVSFRVTKYRSIENSGEVSVDGNITTFVGVNESGKTNLMRALKKLNQDEKEFDDLAENPYWHFETSDPKEIFVQATFKLNNDEIEQVRKITRKNLSLDTITFSKNKAMELKCHLGVESLPFNIFKANYLAQIKTVIDSINVGSLEPGQKYIDNLLNAYNAIGEGVSTDADIRQSATREQVMQQVDEFQQTLNSIPYYAKMDKIIDIINKANFQMNNRLIEVQKYLTKRLPRFIYFENTAMINGSIHLPTFIRNSNSDDLDAGEKTTQTLLDLGSLEAPELFLLGREDAGNREQVKQNKARLNIILRKASKRVSDKIGKVWSQNKHSIKFTVDGDDLMVWVTNKVDNMSLPLRERSRGYRWFFSFYTIFNAESDRGHKDAIILLDEPALFLHPKGQSDFLKFVLPEIATKNQIIYTTHSPFMVDLAKPSSLHTVTLKDTPVGDSVLRTTHVSGEVWDSDREALFPLQSALNYTMAQSMFIGAKNLVVEGMTDLLILKSMSYVLQSASKVHLNNEIVIVPANGAAKIPLLATIYKSQELDVTVLLDADSAGKKSYDSIVKGKILHCQKVLLLNTVYNQPAHMSIEDLFPEEYYLKFVMMTYQNKMQKNNISKISLDSKHPLIVKRLESYFEDKNLGSFNKTKLDRAIADDLRVADIDKLPKELIEKFEILFDKINKTIL